MSVADIKKAKESKESFKTKFTNKIQDDSMLDETHKADESGSVLLLSDDDNKSSYKKDYNIDVELKGDEKPSLILYKYRWVVLFAFFLTSCSTGALTGSLSTNRDIIVKISDDRMNRNILQIAKYADLVLYFPVNFASIWVIENYGLKLCISIGSLIMIGGSLLRFS